MLNVPDSSLQAIFARWIQGTRLNLDDQRELLTIYLNLQRPVVANVFNRVLIPFALQSVELRASLLEALKQKNVETRSRAVELLAQCGPLSTVTVLQLVEAAKIEKAQTPTMNPLTLEILGSAISEHSDLLTYDQINSLAQSGVVSAFSESSRLTLTRVSARKLPSYNPANALLWNTNSTDWSNDLDQDTRRRTAHAAELAKHGGLKTQDVDAMIANLREAKFLAWPAYDDSKNRLLASLALASLNDEQFNHVISLLEEQPIYLRSPDISTIFSKQLRGDNHGLRDDTVRRLTVDYLGLESKLNKVQVRVLPNGDVSSYGTGLITPVASFVEQQLQDPAARFHALVVEKFTTELGAFGWKPIMAERITALLARAKLTETEADSLARVYRALPNNPTSDQPTLFANTRAELYRLISVGHPNAFLRISGLPASAPIVVSPQVQIVQPAKAIGSFARLGVAINKEGLLKHIATEAQKRPLTTSEIEGLVADLDPAAAPDQKKLQLGLLDILADLAKSYPRQFSDTAIKTLAKLIHDNKRYADSDSGAALVLSLAREKIMTKLQEDPKLPKSGLVLIRTSGVSPQVYFEARGSREEVVDAGVLQLGDVMNQALASVLSDSRKNKFGAKAYLAISFKDNTPTVSEFLSADEKKKLVKEFFPKARVACEALFATGSN